MDNDRIKELLSGLPDEPGVYLMKDERGVIIYAGKANSLKKRVSSYFQKKDHDPKTRVLVKNIFEFEFIVTDSEIEALILESNLIKKHKPKFNIRLKDDKRYPYIAVKFDEEYPRIVYTRKITDRRNRYFGPYTDARAAKNSLEMINRIFRLKTCSRPLPLKKNERPCINFQIGRCQGPCTGSITKEEYLVLIDNAVKFLEGHIEPVAENLQSLMKAYSDSMEYEKAQHIRDIIFDMQKISETQKVDVPIGYDQDYITASIRGGEAILILFEFRKGLLLGRKISVFENTEHSSESEVIRSFVLEYYERSEIPQRIVVKNLFEDRDVLEKYLSGKSSQKVSITQPVSPDDRGIINMMIKNLDIIFADRKASEEYVNADAGTAELRAALSMDKNPDVIECFDISNIQGSYAVASMVCFRDGFPDKSSYRRFRIRSLDTPNDPAMIHEAVSRRIQHLVNENLDLPDLIIIDGGVTQLSRAIEAASNFEVDIKIISIAKRLEEIYFDPSKPPIRLPETSPALHIVQNIRDEAHRFAITYHRSIRTKGMVASGLDEIPDIGDKTKKILFKHLKSIENIQAATVEVLTSVPGIGKATAEKIYKHFHENIDTRGFN